MDDGDEMMSSNVFKRKFLQEMATKTETVEQNSEHLKKNNHLEVSNIRIEGNNIRSYVSILNVVFDFLQLFHFCHFSRRTKRVDFSRRRISF